MTQPATRLTVFVAGPSDTQREAAEALGLIDSLDKVLCPRLGLAIRGVRGSRDAPGGVGRPQSRINPLVDECSLLIGIFHGRLGSPTGRAGSGSVEEVRRAFSRRVRSKTEPEIILFFRELSARERESADQQLSGLLRFRKDIGSKLLWMSYANQRDFARRCLEQLVLWLLRIADAAAVTPAKLRPGPGEKGGKAINEGRQLGRRNR